MKEFEVIDFDLAAIENQVDEFRNLLGQNKPLEETEHIRPFFTDRKHLSTFLASYHPKATQFNHLAYEFDFFGDFKCDIATGDSASKSYCFIEFEDATPTSIFVKKEKLMTEWSPRFEHGYSQIIDWFWKLEDLAGSDTFKRRFDCPKINYIGILVLGRSNYLSQTDKDRLQWRQNHTIVNSKNIFCITFDELLSHLEVKLSVYKMWTRKVD